MTNLVWGSYNQKDVLVVAENRVEIIKDIRKTFPSLTIFGYGTDRFRKGETFLKDRDAMTSTFYTEHFKKCCLWLSLQGKLKNIKKDQGSYGYKHSVENFFLKLTGTPEHVTNGMFIAAAYALGFTVKRQTENSVNAYLNLKHLTGFMEIHK